MQTIYDAKILIVDDNQDLLNLVTTALRSTGYNQLTACTGCAAAQAAFAANRPDLMILDINLPDGDGFTLIGERTVTDTITVEGDQIRNLFAMTPYFWKTPHVGALRLAAKQSLTTEIGFRFLAYRRV